MKKIFIIALTLLCSWSYAQTPKWADNARRSVVSVITYDKDGNIKGTGNGFFIRENGIALSDYTLFKDAQSAVVVDVEGSEYSVDCILGANSMYDIVKFRIKTDKSVTALSIAKEPVSQNGTVYVLPYASQKQATPERAKIVSVSTIETKYQYYTLELKTTDKSISCPVTNVNGEVIGMIQRSAEAESTSSYAIDVAYVAELTLNALSGVDYALNSIGIRKGLPEDINQAQVYLIMMSSKLSQEEYFMLINDFIDQFPTMHEGYLRRATYYMTNFTDEESYKLATEDMQKAIEMSTNKDDTYYNICKLIYQAVINGLNYPEWTMEKAMEMIDHAIQISSQPLYIQAKGELYLSMQDYQNAFDCFMQVNNSNLRSEESLFNAARCKQYLGEQDEALALMDSTIAFLGSSLTKKAAPYVFHRGQMKMEQQQYREAVADFNEYERLMLGEAGAEFYYVREQAEIQCRLNQQAINDIEKAVEMEPDQLVYIIEQIVLYTKFNLYEKAIPAAKKGIELDPENSDLYRMLGYCQLQMGLKKEGTENLLKAKELGDPSAEDLIKKYAK